MLGMMRMGLTSSFCTVEVPMEQVKDVDAGMQLMVKLDFLVVGPHSAVIIVERLKFLYEVL
jgi:hypothetical protein